MSVGRAQGPAAEPGQGLLARSFAPLLGAAPRVLVLGSVPGRASLRAGRYYAHPRNQFWPIMQALLGLDPAADYRQRCAALIEAGVALWDVIAECQRPGSLDARITAASIRANPVAALLQRAPSIGCVACNGRRAHAEFRRHVLPALPDRGAGLELLLLPSTSPAYAALSPAAKLEAWRSLLPWLRLPEPARNHCASSATGAPRSEAASSRA